MAGQKNRARNARRGGGAAARGGGAARSGGAAKGGAAAVVGPAAKGASPAAQGYRSSARGGNGQATPGEVRPSAKAAPQTAGAPRWLRITTLVLSVIGLGLSIYLTIAHLTTSKILVCSDKGIVNCGAVTTSAESKVFGIFPVAELGLAFYVFMVAINSPWAWRSKLPAIYWARLGSVIIGMVFVLYLIYAELIEIRNICLFCSEVHVVTFALFALLVFDASSRPARSAGAGIK
jgi:uncharacterized membrane protein